ncbi:MAG: sigma-E factor negative regulatory protein [Spongiibacteraceae bacterium]
MTDRLRESVSALIDGEADDLEWRRLLASDDFPQVRTTWADFQRARGGLNGIDAAIANLDISARVQAALVLEEQTGASEEPASVAVGAWRWWRPAASVAVAASMAAIVVMGVNNFSGTEPDTGVSVADARVTTAASASPETVAISPTAGKVFPAMPSPLRGSSTVSASYGANYGNVPANIVVPAHMYGSSQARADAEAQLRRRLQAYLLMQVEREAVQPQTPNP